MDMKAAFKETVMLATEQGMHNLPAVDPSLGFGHLVDMLQVVEEEDFSEGKLGRWLGWAQAAVVAAGVATLEEMKAINVKHSGNDPLPLDPYPWATSTGTRGSKWLEKYDHIITFAPRAGYEQSRANYPEGVR